MAGQTTLLQKTYKLVDPEGISLYVGVVRGGNSGECMKPTMDNMIPLGVVTNDELLPENQSPSSTGRNVAVQLQGIANIKLAESVSYGDRIILGAGGLGKKALAEGTSNVLGFAEKGGVEGDVIPVMLQYHTYTAV